MTPLRDGMNLVAKEYVASQDPDDPGVLVLSCFAGAAQELTEALIVNPFDVEGMAEAILQGLDMPLGERKERWSAMMTILRRNDITAWRENFVRGAGAEAAARIEHGAPRDEAAATWLVGDIGATNARFGLVAPTGAIAAHSRSSPATISPTIDDARRGLSRQSSVRRTAARRRRLAIARRSPATRSA